MKDLPPLHTLQNYTVSVEVKPLVNERNKYPGYSDPKFSEPQLEFNTHVCVKYKSVDEESKYNMPDGLSCQTRHFLPYQQFAAESNNKERIEIVGKSILDSLYIPFDLDKNLTATKIVDAINYASSPTNNPVVSTCNVLPLAVEIAKTIVLPNAIFEAYSFWYRVLRAFDPNFLEEYKRAISRPRTSEEESEAERSRRLGADQVTDLEGLGDDDDDKACSICMEEMNPGYAIKLGCSHIFHIDCLVKWKRQAAAAKSVRCPLCRAEWWIRANWSIWADWQDSQEKLDAVIAVRRQRRRRRRFRRPS